MKQERNLEIRKLAHEGVIYDEIAIRFGITKQRVCQIVQSFGTTPHIKKCEKQLISEGWVFNGTTWYREEI